jgi:hypothetical protein
VLAEEAAAVLPRHALSVGIDASGGGLLAGGSLVGLALLTT